MAILLFSHSALAEELDLTFVSQDSATIAPVNQDLEFIPQAMQDIVFYLAYTIRYLGVGKESQEPNQPDGSANPCDSKQTFPWPDLPNDADSLLIPTTIEGLGPDGNGNPRFKVCGGAKGQPDLQGCFSMTKVCDTDGHCSYFYSDEKGNTYQILELFLSDNGDFRVYVRGPLGLFVAFRLPSQMQKLLNNALTKLRVRRTPNGYCIGFEDSDSCLELIDPLGDRMLPDNRDRVPFSDPQGRLTNLSDKQACDPIMFDGFQ
ncbi:MAG: hypothetical protein KDD64_04155 [Bdellovibrionales bacterium]|nr:hypothetical protein [Bdellovibrionales bacterium]